MREASIVRLISGAMIVIKGARWNLTFFGHMPHASSYHIFVAFRCIRTSGAYEWQSTGKIECDKGMRQSLMVQNVQFSALSI